MAYKTAK